MAVFHMTIGLLSKRKLGRMIYQKTVVDGYGSHRMSSLLNNMGYRMHSGAKFQCNSVNRILANPIYCGFIKFGDALSTRRKDLQIIEDDMFQNAQYILAERAQKKPTSATSP